MKRILLDICNSLMAASIAHTLKQAKGFLVVSAHGESVAEACLRLSADIVIMEAAYDNGATVGDCLKEVCNLRRLCPKCRSILLCDENSAPEIARQVAQAKKDGRIDDFIYSSVSESYLTAMLYAI